MPTRCLGCVSQWLFTRISEKLLWRANDDGPSARSTNNGGSVVGTTVEFFGGCDAVSFHCIRHGVWELPWNNNSFATTSVVSGLVPKVVGVTRGKNRDARWFQGETRF